MESLSVGLDMNKIDTRLNKNSGSNNSKMNIQAMNESDNGLNDSDDDNYEHRSAYKANSHLLPAIPERGDASAALSKSIIQPIRGRSSKNRLSGVENTLAVQRSYNAPLTASDNGQRPLDKSEKLLTLVKQSPYANYQSQATLA